MCGFECEINEGINARERNNDQEPSRHEMCVCVCLSEKDVAEREQGTNQQHELNLSCARVERCLRSRNPTKHMHKHIDLH